jgi:holo-[acyl-carrier protein] synthase
MILGSGLDLIEVSRFERESARRGVGLFEEVFTPAERLLWGALSRPARGFAMGWAAKEACWKALGTGKIDAMAWHDIEVNWTPPSHPAVTLRGDTAAAAEHRGVTSIMLSLACTKTRAVAWALIQGPGTGDRGSVVDVPSPWSSS